jgi:trans-aconitate 2-methyltransferase
MEWQPDRYCQFSAERAAPFEDLCALIPIRPGISFIDLGCGTGELTCRLADLLPESRGVGLDSSPEMLGKAAALRHPRVEFRQGDAASCEGAWDLVFSNAVFHWIDDHPALFTRLYDRLAPGGQLAVQIPNNNAFPSHTAIIATAGEEPFRTALGGYVRVSPLLSLDEYAALLHGCGAEGITVLEKVYLHPVADSDAIADWTAGTTLLPYRERLAPDLYDRFLASYRAKLRAIWPVGPVLFTFRRILIAARRPA